MQRAVAVLAGRDMPIELVARWLNWADFILAADAGADIVREAGFTPHEIVGDLDSISSVPDGLPVFEDSNQNDTDCDKALRRAFELGIAEITLICVEGDQLDHMLATLQSAAKAALSVRIGLRAGLGVVMVGGDEIRLPTRPGARVSLVPISSTEGVSLKGVEWPLDHSELDPLGATSISNRATGNEIWAHALEGAAFLFVEGDPPA